MYSILLLVGKDNKLFEFCNNDEIDGSLENLYNKGIIVKILRHFEISAGLSLGEWKRNIEDYDVIFTIDSFLTPQVLKWICNHKKNGRVILYFRNKYVESKKRWKLNELKKLPVEIWSYNIHDCEQYGFRYNSQVLNKELFEGYDNSLEKYSMAFVGANKGRDKIITSIYELLKDSGLPEPYIYMLGADDKIWNKCKDNNSLPYSEYIKVISRSIAVLDLISDENKGLTFRPIEAMFLKKKLITNYTDIKNYDFYRYENIYILGDDDRSLDSFLKSPYMEIPKCIIDSYNTDSWIRRFFK